LKSRAARGALDVSGGVRYNNIAIEFYLNDSVIEALGIQGVPEKQPA